jgi:hypothetical protein
MSDSDGCLLLSLIGLLAFWGVIGYVVFHFVVKFW